MVVKEKKFFISLQKCHGGGGGVNAYAAYVSSWKISMQGKALYLGAN